MPVLNKYETTFYAFCPTNGARIKYHLRIESNLTIKVEEILKAVGHINTTYHEDAADALFAAFGGKQTITADHHSVTITTERSA